MVGKIKTEEEGGVGRKESFVLSGKIVFLMGKLSIKITARVENGRKLLPQLLRELITCLLSTAINLRSSRGGCKQRRKTFRAQRCRLHSRCASTSSSTIDVNGNSSR